jgi:membrane fusion protein (multidrug efflux system)
MSNALVADDVASPAKAAARPRSRRSLLIWLAVIGVLVGTAYYAAQWVTTGQYVETTDDAYVGGNVTDIAPQIDGVIQDVAVTDNQAVHQGDLLMRIDPRDFAAALDKARAAVAGDQADLANLAATRALQMSVIDEAQADSAAAAAAAQLARSNQDRYARLAASHAGSLQDSQTADANFAQAQAGVARAQAALAAARAQLDVIATEAAKTRAALAGAVADQAMAELNLGYTEIRAPFDGVVGNRSAHVGGYATAGAQVISIVPAAGLWVDANFKEDQLARLKAGQVVDIRADVAPGEKITGHVQGLAPASGSMFSILPAENATGNFTKIVQRVPVRITLDGDAGRLGVLRPGLSVTVSVDTK